MEKPGWRTRASKIVVSSPHMRLRVDEVELADGTIVEDYYVRESYGFVVVVPFTDDGRIVMVRQYRYGSDAIHLEVPAGGLNPGEDRGACAQRELLEETGFQAARWTSLGSYHTEPARGNSVAYLFAAFEGRKMCEPELEPTEVLEVELVEIQAFRRMLADGRVDAAHAIVAGYRALDRLHLL